MITRFVGMDIHQRYAVVTAVNGAQEEVLPSQRVEMAQLARWSAQHLSQQDAVVLEVTTNTWAVVEVLERYAGNVVVANPYQTKLIAQARIKNDRVDARALAQLLAAHFIPEVWVPSRQMRRWRRMARQRGRLRQQCTQTKNRIHQLLTVHNLRCPERQLFSRQGRAWLTQQSLPQSDHWIMQQLLAQLDFLDAQLQECEQHIARLAQQDPRVGQLLQITGVGVYTAFSLVAVIDDIQRFPSPRQLASYFGLVPRQHQSGKHSYHGRITKAGDRLARWLLVEAAHIAVRWDEHWRQVHARIAQRRGTNIASVAVARKLAEVIWHMLTHGTTYTYLRPVSYVRKLQDWAYRIGRHHLSAPSSRDFVADRLVALHLPHLAQALITTGRNARLGLAAPVT